MKSFIRTLALITLTAGISAPALAEAERVFEMRTYTTHEGKLPDLHARFKHHTRWLFEKHGMMNIAYWTPTDPELAENTLTYILMHASREAAKESWTAFSNDPQWQAVYEKSRENGPLVKHIESTFMTPTDYSRIR